MMQGAHLIYKQKRHFQITNCRCMNITLWLAVTSAPALTGNIKIKLIWVCKMQCPELCKQNDRDNWLINTNKLKALGDTMSCFLRKINGQSEFLTHKCWSSFRNCHQFWQNCGSRFIQFVICLIALNVTNLLEECCDKRQELDIFSASTLNNLLTRYSEEES